jgi:hypothetical protein
MGSPFLGPMAPTTIRSPGPNSRSLGADAMSEAAVKHAVAGRLPGWLRAATRVDPEVQIAGCNARTLPVGVRKLG